MFGENTLPVYLVAGVAAVLTIGSLFPPVISRGGSADLTSKEVASKAQEFAYCQSNLDDVNCACFAGIAGHIMAQDTPDFRGSIAADRAELARSQASQSC